ncbi:MAG: response regulator [Fibromonadaceae bacterium]|jgi:signal transduction histidine kinase/DNA-binding response OmpR family regulator/HAMP domain-containing protein|nr:response regulator [Fibromonadaceae bacterium]
MFQNHSVIDQVKRGSLENSINSLNAGAVESIERMTTDIAKSLADFLYERDDDIRYLATLANSLNGDIKSIEKAYSTFVRSKTKRAVVQTEWVLSKDGNRWVRKNIPDVSGTIGKSSNKNNEDNVNGATFNPIAADGLEYTDVPLYDEVTFIGLDGMEKVKVGTADLPNSRKNRYANYFKTGNLKDISLKENTFIRAETYYPALKELTGKEGSDIYVSDVIGAYVGTNFIGMYTKPNLEDAAKKRGYDINYAPEEQAFSGEENPVGKRFEGIVRWASPVYVNGEKIGYVTLALNQDHIMGFVDHKTPMKERYKELSSAYEGNYSFIWDYQSRSIAHPRHHSIYGFDPETGEEQIPWLMTTEYNMLLEKSGISAEQAKNMTPEQKFAVIKANWKNFINKEADETGKPVYDLLLGISTFKNQKRMDPNNPDPDHTPAADLTRLGFVGLDGRYLNNAPQCTGWLDLTKRGGSGSLYILWSGIYKLNTAAAIPYYTGRYAPCEANSYSRVGFGFIAIGSGIESFTEPAVKAAQKTDIFLEKTSAESMKYVITSLLILFIITLLVSFAMSRWFSTSINTLLQGVAKYRSGLRQFRFNSKQSDEFGEIAESFDMLAESIERSIYHSVVITDSAKNIIYMNRVALALHKGETFEMLAGKPYIKYSIYPEKTEYDPFYAYENGTESSIYHREKDDIYVKGKVMALLDNNNVKIGYIIESYDVTEIEKRNRIVEEQYNQLAQTQGELKDALQKAQEATKAKSIFLANMSHEIRTPLNAVIGFTEVELMHKLPPSTIGSLEKIYSSSKTLLNIINDILDISKIEAGKIQLNPVEYDLATVISDSVNINLVRMGDKPLRLNIIVDENIPQKLFGDDLRLRQIFDNLLSNAVKYSNSGTITFSIKSALEKISETETICRLECYVQDTGIGISEEDLPKLFGDYQMVNMLAHRNTEGTGLGLAICKTMIEMMDGKIWVESKLNNGSKFMFNIKAKVIDENPIGSETAHNLMSLNYTKSLRDVETAFLFEEKPHGRILIVDDVATNLEVAKRLMEPYKMNIETAMSGYEALDRIKTQETCYDIIFMDYMMPGMDGIETTKIIRELGYKGIIVVLTANAVVGADKMFRENGFDDFISKPIDIKNLDAIIKKYVRENSSEALLNITRSETRNAPRETDKKIFEMFRRDAEKAIATLKDSAESGDLKSFSLTVHSIKSACVNIREKDAADLAVELEIAGRNGNLDKVRANYSALVEKLKEILARRQG